MNAKHISPASNVNSTAPTAGAVRVRRISQALKAMVLIYLVVLPLYFIADSLVFSGVGQTTGHSVSKFPALSVGEKLAAAVSTAIYLLIAVTFYRLLNLYEKGTFFSLANVRLFRLLGYLAFSNGLLGVVAPVVSTGQLVFPILLLNILGSPWAIGGLFGIMISLIMDEGCRMREEQELTV